MEELEVGDIVCFKGQNVLMTVTLKSKFWFCKTFYNFSYFDSNAVLNITTGHYAESVIKRKI